MYWTNAETILTSQIITNRIDKYTIIISLIHLTMEKHLNPLALGIAAGGVAAISMLVLGIMGNIGLYTGAVNMMQEWHMFFSLDVIGIITGMLEAAIISFVSLFIFGWLYNKFLK